MGTPCVAGAGRLHIDAAKRTLTVNGKTYGPDDFLSLDGGTGESTRARCRRSRRR
jgi:pyruvate,orthophosphate dikinase